MSTPIADFREPVRAFLDDFNSTVRKYADASIDAVIKALLRCGELPGFALDGPGTSITPDITTPAQYATLVYNACLMLVAPRSHSRSFRTRALSVTQGNQRDLLLKLESKLTEIRNAGYGFISWTDFKTWTISVTGVNPWEQMTEMRVDAPVATVTIGREGLQVND